MRRRDRWLSMAELARMMKLPHKNVREARRYVRRTLRNLEQRDGATYLRRLGPGRGKLYVSVGLLEKLMPWDAGTLTAMRGDIDGLGVKVKRLKRRVDRHDIDITGLAEFCRKQAELLHTLPALIAPKGAKKGAGGTA